MFMSFPLALQNYYNRFSSVDKNGISVRRQLAYLLVYMSFIAATDRHVDPATYRVFIVLSTIPRSIELWYYDRVRVYCVRQELGYVLHTAS